MAQQVRLHHVSVPRPWNSDAQVRAFYGDLLGLAELPIPATLHDQGLIWYRLGDSELHVFSAALPVDREGAHFCLAGLDLAALRPRLTAAGYQVTDAVAIPGRPRFFCHDPFGNLIEFTTLVQG